MLNKVMIIGRLGSDPVLRYTQGGVPIANFNVATDESYTDPDGVRQEKTEWHRIVVFQRQAENCASYLAKGSLVYIEGSLQTRKWQDQQGQDRYATEIKAQRVKFLERKSDRYGEGESVGYGQTQQPRYPRDNQYNSGGNRQYNSDQARANGNWQGQQQRYQRDNPQYNGNRPYGDPGRSGSFDNQRFNPQRQGRQSPYSHGSGSDMDMPPVTPSEMDYGPGPGQQMPGRGAKPTDYQNRADSYANPGASAQFSHDPSQFGPDDTSPARAASEKRGEYEPEMPAQTRGQADDQAQANGGAQQSAPLGQNNEAIGSENQKNGSAMDDVPF